ncbi:MAG TPA: hypothetical protein VF698_21100 [Thermoanaerobaculia bacterium]
MRFPRGLLTLVAAIAAISASAQPALLCPPGAGTSGRACEAFHYHAQLYRPDTRGFVDWYAPPFASQSSCERAREAQMKRNLTVVDFLQRSKGEGSYQPDRFGPCHCDMTSDPASANYLSDAQRTAQWRAAEEARQRAREKLLDVGLASDTEAVRSVWAPLPSTPILGAPKFVPPPAVSSALAPANAADLKATRAIELNRPAAMQLDLPLIDLSAPVAAVAAASPAAVNAAEPPAEGIPPRPAPPAATAPAGEVILAVPAEARPEVRPEVREVPAEVVVQADKPPSPPAEEPSSEELASAAEAAESFISVETQRIQNVLKASSVIADESVKSKIFEACMQRIQLLSNLRLLIEGSGMRSRLAAAARAAMTEEQRLALVAKLFGNDITRHWAPGDAADVVLEPQPELAEPERVLRDDRADQQLRKRALYLVLAQSQPAEEQRLWLTTVIDSFLQ